MHSDDVLTISRAAAHAAPIGPPGQVADRWHLLKNLREMVERLFARHPGEIRQAFLAGAPEADPVPAGSDGTPARPRPVAPRRRQPMRLGVPTVREQTRAAKEATRNERDWRVCELLDRGHSLRRIARQLHLSRQTVSRNLCEPKCPSLGHRGRRSSRLDEHHAFIADWVARGGQNASELHRLLRAKGCRVGYRGPDVR